MAEAGRGEVEYVSLSDDGSAAAKRFHERVHNPLLTDISIEWNGLPVTDVLPARIPDLFSAKPVVLTGRYSNPGKGTLRLRGKLGGAPFVREIAVDFPAALPVTRFSRRSGHGRGWTPCCWSRDRAGGYAPRTRVPADDAVHIVRCCRGYRHH